MPANTREVGGTLPLTEVRDRLSQIVDDVVANGGEWTITKHGRPVAVIVSADDHAALIETLNLLSDDVAMEAITEGLEDIDAGRVSEA